MPSGVCGAAKLGAGPPRGTDGCACGGLCDGCAAGALDGAWANAGQANVSAASTLRAIRHLKLRGIWCAASPTYRLFARMHKCDAETQQRDQSPSSLRKTAGGTAFYEKGMGGARA